MYSVIRPAGNFMIIVCENKALTTIFLEIGWTTIIFLNIGQIILLRNTYFLFKNTAIEIWK